MKQPHNPLPQPDSAPRRRGFGRADTSRAEAFSDGVFAIAVTILVLSLATPAHRPGGLGRALLSQWPAYVGYLASFTYVSVIWLNHHQAFARIRAMDRGLQAANLSLLGTTALLAFPTGVLADTLRAGTTSADARAAVALYGAVAAAMCASWIAIYARLSAHPRLLHPDVEPDYVRLGLIRSAAGCLVYLLAAAAGVLWQPLLALAAFLVLPVFYFLTSDGALRRRR